MKVVGLVSGGKDSCYNLMQCIRHGHEVIVLANLRPADSYDELDSYMYQTVGYQLLGALAECVALPLVQRPITGSPALQDLNYSVTEKDEVEDLFMLLKEVKEKYPEVEAVSCGAILSNYQRLRVENVCGRLGLISLAYLWHQDQMELLQSMIMASFGLTPEKHLGKSLKELFPELVKLSKQYELNVCGEGGEYESFVLDCPLFKKRIVIDEKETIIHSNDAFATVAFLRVLKWHLEDKPQEESNLTFLLASPLQSSSLSIPSQKNATSFKWTSPAKEEEEKEGLLVKFNKIGDFFYLSGTSRQNGKSSDQQIGEILAKVKEELESIKLNMGLLSFLNVYVNNMADFGRINQEYLKHFGSNPASRACVQPTEVEEGKEWMKVECIGSTLPRNVLHVQSISKWAPACIGPYSQAVQVNPNIFLAGQIGLDPPTMQIVKGGYEEEFKQVLFNLQQVLQEVSSSIIYCTSLSVFIVEGVSIPIIDSLLNQFITDKLDEANLVEQVKPIITFIELAALPRKALVEVVVTSLNKTCEIDHYLPLPIVASSSDTGFIQETKGLICNDQPEDSVLLSFLQTKIGTSQPSMDHHSFFISTSQKIQELTQAHIRNQSPLFVRIYYSKSIIGPVLNDLEGTLAKYNIAPVTLIPVLGLFFERKDHQESVCLLCITMTW